MNFDYKDPVAGDRYVNGVLQEPSVGVAIYLTTYKLYVEESAVSVSPDIIECFGKQAELLRENLPRLLGNKKLEADGRIPLS